MKTLKLGVLGFALTALGTIAYLPQSSGVIAGSSGAGSARAISYGTPYRYNQGFGGSPSKFSAGDIWPMAWGSDGGFYSLCNDCWGANDSIPNGRDMVIVKLTTVDTSTTMSNVNPLDAYSNQMSITGTDNLAFKGFGFISVHGTMYLTTGRQSDQKAVPYHYYQNGQQIIKSSDNGATWSPTPISPGNPVVNQPFNYAGPPVQPMWPPNMGGLWFVNYDKQDYVGQTYDGSDQWVYGISNGTYWNNDDNVYLSRVSVANIGNLNAADWAWYQGGDGSNSANWGAIGTRENIIANPGHMGSTTAQFMPFCQCYYMIEWYYPAAPASNDYSTTVWLTYTAKHVWGPWSLIDTHTWTPGGYYSPSFASPSVAANGGRTAMVLTTGDFHTYATNSGTTLYTLTMIPATLN